MEDPSDAELLRRVPHDEAAFTAFYRRHVRDVLGFLVRRTGDADLAADLTAEVFAQVLRSAGRYRPDRGDPGSWLLGIASHKQIDAHRRGRADAAARRRLRMRRIPLADEDRAMIAALGSAVETALDELPADQRDAVRGRVLDDLGYDELARRANVAPAAIRQRVARGLAALRTRMEQR
jgi:RNA polymerase sigma factor (sigma-70 family)